MSSRLAAFLARVTAVAALAAVVQGCDFVRTVLGRPDSAAIAQARLVRSERQEQRRQARLAMERRKADSTAAVNDSLFVAAASRNGVVFKKLSSLKSQPAEPPGFRYCLMMGYFSMKGNAVRLASLMEADGLRPLLIGFSSGATGVALFPSDRAEETVAGMESVRNRAYFPDDSWIIVNDLLPLAE